MRTGLLIFNLFVILTTRAQDLDGDWMYTPTHGEVYTSHVGLRIKGDSLFEMTNMGLMRLGTYHLDSDSFSYKTQEGQTLNYRLLKTRDTLTLISNSGSINKYHNRKLEYDPNLSFNKITFDGFVDRNGFSKILISINRNGKARFTGQKTATTVHQKFKVDKKTINKIDSTFKWSFIKVTNNESITYDSEFELPFTITIEYNQNQKTLIKGTLARSPYRTRMIRWFLFHELRERKLL